VDQDNDLDGDDPAKYLQFLYHDDGNGLDGNNRLNEEDLEMAIKGIDNNIKILGDRIAKYFDF